MRDSCSKAARMRFARFASVFMSLAGCISHATIFPLTDVYLFIPRCVRKRTDWVREDSGLRDASLPPGIFFLARAVERTGTSIARSVQGSFSTNLGNSLVSVRVRSV